MAHPCCLRMRPQRRQFGVQRTRLNESVATQVDPRPPSEGLTRIGAQRPESGAQTSPFWPDSKHKEAVAIGNVCRIGSQVR